MPVVCCSQLCHHSLDSYVLIHLTVVPIRLTAVPIHLTVVLIHLTIVPITSCPAGTEAASLDITKAYRNSPILPKHKKYLPIFWRNKVYIQHVAIEGLATASGIQGTIADACLRIFSNIME